MRTTHNTEMREVDADKGKAMSKAFDSSSDLEIFVSAHSYLPGRLNTNERLRQDLSTALNDFSLTGANF